MESRSLAALTGPVLFLTNHITYQAFGIVYSSTESRFGAIGLWSTGNNILKRLNEAEIRTGAQAPCRRVLPQLSARNRSSRPSKDSRPYGRRGLRRASSL